MEQRTSLDSLHDLFFRGHDNRETVRQTLRRTGLARRLQNFREISLAKQFARGRTLDVGAGMGRLTIPLHDAGLEVIGLDESAENLEVAKLAAGDRPLTWIQASPLDLPFPSGTLDSLVSTTTGYSPQWFESLAEFVRVLAPGGRLIFTLGSADHVQCAHRVAPPRPSATLAANRQPQLAPVTADVVIQVLGELDLVPVHLCGYAVFSSNEVIEASLGSQAQRFYATLEEAMRRPGALELWDFLERELFGFLPLSVSRNTVIVAEVPDDRGGAPAAWQAPERIRHEGTLNATVLQEVMGPAFEGFRRGLNASLALPGSIHLLAALDELAKGVLPLQIDFLPLLEYMNRARVADQVAWAWTRNWHQDLSTWPFFFGGIELGPLLDYEVFDHLCRMIRPHLGEFEPQSPAMECLS